MQRNPRYRKTLFGALLASLALHALVAPFFARSSTSPETGGIAAVGTPVNERIRYAVVGRFSIESPRAKHVKPTNARPSKLDAHRLPTPTTATHVRSTYGATLAIADIRPKRPSRPRVGHADAAGRAHEKIAMTIATAEPDQPIIDPTPTTPDSVATLAPMSPTPKPTPTPLAIAEPTAAARVVALRAQSGNPPGGWGASFEEPLVADETALDELRARYRGARAIRIDVDEAGHATRVVAPASMPTDLRTALEHELLALHYVPAECNGLRCGGTLQLSL
jgi:hypothetical protein